VSDDLDALAWRAVVTPSTDALGSFTVLVDALLERGDIAEIQETPAEDLAAAIAAAAASGVSIFTGTVVRSPTVLEQAWLWAKERAGPPFLERLRRAIRGIDLESIDLLTGAALDRMEDLHGLRRTEPAPPYVEGESDEALRARCLARFRGMPGDDPSTRVDAPDPRRR
jgi:hypothetical protein